MPVETKKDVDFVIDAIKKEKNIEDITKITKQR
jgi:hypothetical protein